MTSQDLIQTKIGVIISKIKEQVGGRVALLVEVNASEQPVSLLSSLSFDNLILHTNCSLLD